MNYMVQYAKREVIYPYHTTYVRICKGDDKVANKEKTKENPKEKKFSFAKVMSNTAFALKVCFKYNTVGSIIQVIVQTVSCLLAFITNTYLLKYIIDSYAGGLGFEAVAKTVIILIVVPTSINMVLNFLLEFVWSVGAYRLIRKIDEGLYKKNISADLARFEDPEFYDKYEKASSDMTMYIFRSFYRVVYLFSSVLNTILYGGLLFTMDPVFIIFALIPLVGSFFKKKSNVLWHKHTTEDKIVHRRCQYVQRVFYSNEYAKEMRLTNAKNFMLNKYDEASDGRREIVKKYGKKEMLLDILGSKISDIIANPLAIAYAVFRTIVTGTLGMGDCVVVINSVSQLSNSFIGFANHYYEMHGNALFIEDYREFMRYEPKIVDKPDATEAKCGTLKLENVSFKYFGSEDYALKNINIEVKKNEKIALVGHNGAGKSTLVKLLLRLYDPTEGNISLNGENIRDIKVKSYRDMFGVVFQDFKIMALPVIENVLMRPRRPGDTEKVEEALKLSGVYDRIMELPNGMETVLTKEFSEDGAVLSVGEGQKIAIAHAFVKDAPYIILDEPTSALDPVAESEMYNNMMEIGKDKGMIFISHRLSSAVAADRIYMLENGEIIESGTHAELMAQNGKYADMFRKQAQNYVEAESEVSV